MAEREVFRFGPFRLDVAERVLARDGIPVLLPPRAFDLLAALARRGGRLARKEELLAEVWPDAVVLESNLTQTVWLLRRTLRQGEGGTVYVATVPKAGYRFVAPVVREEEPEGPTASRSARPVVPALSGPEPSPARQALGGILRERHERTDLGPSGAGAESPSRRRQAGSVVLLAIAVLAALSAGAWLGSRVEPAAVAPTAPVRPGIASLSFENLAHDPAASWLSPALAEMLGAQLAASGELRLVPGDTVARAEADLRQVLADPQQAPAVGPPPRHPQHRLRRLAEMLSVSWLISGSYLVTGEADARQVRLEARLLDAHSGEPLAACSSTTHEANLLRLVADCGARLREGAGLPPLSGEPQRGWLAALPADPEARRLYFEGIRRLRAYDAAGAVAPLTAAVAREPGFPLAHSALATAWNSLGYDARAQEAARRALERSADLSREARLWIEAGYLRQAREWDRAVAALQALFTFYPDQVDYGLRLASSLSFAGRGQEALAVVEQLRRLPEPLRSDPRLDIAEADAADAAGDFRRVAAAASAGVAKARRRGSRGLLSGALGMRASAREALGDVEGAWADHREALALAEALGDRYGQGGELHNMSHLVRRRGNRAGAEAMARRALALLEETGNQRAVSAALGTLAGLAREEGKLREALTLQERALAIKREIGDLAGEGIALNNLGNVHLDLGELDLAERRYREALALRRRTGQPAGIASSLLNLAIVHLAHGQAQRAGPLLAEAETLAARSGDAELLAAVRKAASDLAAAADRGRSAEALP